MPHNNDDDEDHLDSDSVKPRSKGVAELWFSLYSTLPWVGGHRVSRIVMISVQLYNCDSGGDDDDDDDDDECVVVILFGDCEDCYGGDAKMRHLLYFLIFLYFFIQEDKQGRKWD